MVVVGICQGVQPILGYNYGADCATDSNAHSGSRHSPAPWSPRQEQQVGILFPDIIAMAFTTDSALIAATSNSLHISLLAFWVVGFQIVSTTLFQSIGKAGKSIFLSLIRQVIFLIPLLLTLPRMYGLNGVWASFPTSDLFATVVTIMMVAWQFRTLSRENPAQSHSTNINHRL